MKEAGYLSEGGKETPSSIVIFLWLSRSKTLRQAQQNVSFGIGLCSLVPYALNEGQGEQTTYSGDPQFWKARAGIEVMLFMTLESVYGSVRFRTLSVEPVAVYCALVQVPMRSSGRNVAGEATVFPPHRQQVVGLNVISASRSLAVKVTGATPLQYFLELQTMATPLVFATSNFRILTNRNN